MKTRKVPAVTAPKVIPQTPKPQLAVPGTHTYKMARADTEIDAALNRAAEQLEDGKPPIPIQDFFDWLTGHVDTDPTEEL